jgi:predicted dehydrogenase
MKVHGTILFALNRESPRRSVSCLGLIVYVHSRKLGPRFRLLAVIDPVVERATSALRKKCSSDLAIHYRDTRVYDTFQSFIAELPCKVVVHAVVVGSPPIYRGSTQPGKDTEMQILKGLPGAPIFCEKPVATGPPGEIQDAFNVAKSIRESGVVCSVGCVIFGRSESPTFF